MVFFGEKNNLGSQKQIVEEMNSLEYKVVWELENWKKTEVKKLTIIKIMAH